VRGVREEGGGKVGGWRESDGEIGLAVLQYIAVFCSVLQRVAACCSVLQFVALGGARRRQRGRALAKAG